MTAAWLLATVLARTAAAWVPDGAAAGWSFMTTMTAWLAFWDSWTACDAVRGWLAALAALGAAVDDDALKPAAWLMSRAGTATATTRAGTRRRLRNECCWLADPARFLLPPTVGTSWFGQTRRLAPATGE